MSPCGHWVPAVSPADTCRSRLTAVGRPRLADVEQPVARSSASTLRGVRRGSSSPPRTTPSTMSARCRGEPPTSLSSTSRSLIANPASGVRRSSITSTTVGVVVAAPRSLPAVSAETTTEVGPGLPQQVHVLRLPHRRDDADVGAISRAVSVTRTAVSSRFVATTIALASGTPATRSTLDRVALPATVTRPSAAAASSWARSVSTTTMSMGLAPSPSSVSTAARPLVP